MHTLVLMRHAKTEGHNVGGDHSRELTPRGVQEAMEAGVTLRGLGIDGAKVSTAVRTRQTFDGLGLGIPVTYLDELYFDGTDAAARLIATTGEDIGSLLVVGHAPTIPDLAARLLFPIDWEEAQQVGSWFPTCTFSTFHVTTPWSEAFDKGASRYEGTTRSR